jgi:hypothetical protein
MSYVCNFSIKIPRIKNIQPIPKFAKGFLIKWLGKDIGRRISSPTFGAPGRGLGLRFLLVSLLDTMVHIVEHHDLMPEDFMLEEEAASSTPRATNLPAPGAAAAMHSARQHTPAQTSRASRVALGSLSATRELLRHPPSSMASPGAMKQWRDDVDRLLDMAHSGSARPRPRSSRHQHEASASVRSPSVRAAPTEDLRAELNRRRVGEDALVSLERSNDLRAELNRRRAGEDARVSLERARERRQNVEVATSTTNSLQLCRKPQWAPGSKRVSHWPAWATPHWRIISARRPGHPSSGRTYRRSTTVRQTRRNSCRCTSPPLRQQVETPS